METKVVKIDSSNPDIELVKEAARYIIGGELVGFPTETVYGLGANGLDENAVRKIFMAKGRPQDNPLILHVNSIEMLRTLVVEIPDKALKLIDAFWPGPLTILFKKNNIVPEVITAGLDTVAIRMPSHKIALELIGASNTPIAAPSANTSGRPSPTRAEHVIEDMNGKIPFIIDGGETGIGLESTVIDLTEDIPMILRPGGITPRDIIEVLGECKIDPGLEETSIDSTPKSPGQKYRHYAPKAKMFVFTGKSEDVNKEMLIRATKAKHEGKKVGIMTTIENVEFFSGFMIEEMGSLDDVDSIAHNLFHLIRKLDEAKVDLILCQGVERDSIGLAVMNRLYKASGGNIIQL